MYNIKLDPTQNKESDDKNKNDNTNSNTNNKINNPKSLMTQTMKTDDNFNESLKFIRTIPKIELFDRPKITIPTKNYEVDNRYTLVLDLDETLVHSSIEPQSNPDDVFLIEINDSRYTI